jgi:hypothetical protein
MSDEISGALEGSLASLSGKEEDASKNAEYFIHLQVGGVRFVLDPKTIVSFSSTFLTALVDPDSEFKKPDDGIYQVDANAECFSAFLHHARYGDLPYTDSAEKEKLMLDQADFWCIRSRINGSLLRLKQRLTEKVKLQLAEKAKLQNELFSKKVKLHEKLLRAKTHHNYRHDDGHRRIYCTDCGHRDIDSRYSDGDRYTECKQCDKIIYYSPILNWCHKCGRCAECQRTACENNQNDDHCYYSVRGTSTEKLNRELKGIDDDIANLFR